MKKIFKNSINLYKAVPEKFSQNTLKALTRGEKFFYSIVCGGNTPHGILCPNGKTGFSIDFFKKLVHLFREVRGGSLNHSASNQKKIYEAV